MFYGSSEVEQASVLEIAKKMCIAARTAPKGKGIDNIATAILTEQDKNAVADEMEKIAHREGIKFFLRDAANVRLANVLVLIGTGLSERNLVYCGYCGFKDCNEKTQKGGVCAYDTGDLGIAVGSAVCVAADNRVDNRIMFSAGRAALDMKLLGEDIKIVYAIPLCVSGKNIFFDRKKPENNNS